RLFQNFSFWNSNLRFTWKSGHLTAFPRGCFKTNRVLEQPPLSPCFQKKVRPGEKKPARAV
ncbi:MAG: hypothetical protein LBK27_06325, partial [Treponema sp.]|nr:hypothetical protein [Treponema sp.]